MFAPLEMHSKPNEPEPENKSSIFALLIFTLNLLECSIKLKIDSFTNEFLELDKKAIPISRSYKENVLQKLAGK